MRIQNIMDTYKHLPANSIKYVDGSLVIKSENCVIRIIPNLKREIMTQVEDGYQTGFSFYENSSLAEFHQNSMKIPFNANDFAFLKQHNSKQKISKNTMHQKNKILKNSKKQKDMRIDINDRFKDFLKDLPLNSHLNNILLLFICTYE